MPQSNLMTEKPIEHEIYGPLNEEQLRKSTPIGVQPITSPSVRYTS